MTELSREVTEIVGEYAAVCEIKFTPAARMSEADIRELFAREAENIITVLKERAPQVLVPSANPT